MGVPDLREIRREKLEPGDPTLLETLRLAADIHRHTGDVQAETAHRQQEIDQLAEADGAPGTDSVESAIRLLELYREQGETGRIEPLARDIERWLEDGGPELDDLRGRFARVATAESVTE